MSFYFQSILSVFICSLFFTFSQHYDDDCVIEEYKVSKKTKGQLAFIVDVSKNMEPYRVKFQENFPAMLNSLYESNRHEPGTLQFGINMGYITNGCATSHINHYLSVNDRDYERFARRLKAVPTKDNAKSGVENGIVGVYDAARIYLWEDTRTCYTKYKTCLYHYLVLITGSSSSYNISDCRGRPIPSLKIMKQELHKEDHAFRIIGLFPNQSLVQEYEQLAKDLDVPYFGLSFDENPENVLKMPEFLQECLRVDIRRHMEVYGRPCQWEDPIGYNTLGL